MKHTITYTKTDKFLKEGQAQTIRIMDENYLTQRVCLQYSKQGQLSIHIKKVGKDEQWEELKNIITTKEDNPSYIPAFIVKDGELKKLN